MDNHDCKFPEVLIEEGDESGELKVGMRVLIPCVCGETPYDSAEILHRHISELQEALLAQKPNCPLYHWAPVARRKQIIRYGLRPGMRSTTTETHIAPYICFADSPSWAWALSGQMPHSPSGEWDLWMTWLEVVTDPTVLATSDRPSGIYEIRTPNRVYKRDLWYVGSRIKEKL